MAEPRTWSDLSGKFRVEADFVSLEDGKLMLQKKDGTTITVAIEKLSEKDRAVAQALADADGPEKGAEPARTANREVITDVVNSVINLCVCCSGFALDYGSWPCDQTADEVKRATGTDLELRGGNVLNQLVASGRPPEILMCLLTPGGDGGWRYFPGASKSDSPRFVSPVFGETCIVRQEDGLTRMVKRGERENLIKSNPGSIVLAKPSKEQVAAAEAARAKRNNPEVARAELKAALLERDKVETELKVAEEEFKLAAVESEMADRAKQEAAAALEVAVAHLKVAVAKGGEAVGELKAKVAEKEAKVVETEAAADEKKAAAEKKEAARDKVAAASERSWRAVSDWEYAVRALDPSGRALDP
jgi:hypothetical protein